MYLLRKRKRKTIAIGVMTKAPNHALGPKNKCLSRDRTLMIFKGTKRNRGYTLEKMMTFYDGYARQKILKI
jgi:hypothetical protein